MEKNNTVNPEHYHPHGIIMHEPIEIMKNMMSSEAYRGYLMGNIIKYISRYDMKNGVEDLEKAKKYIDFLEAEVQGFSPMYAQNKMK